MLPLIIAILLGLASPLQNSCINHQSSAANTNQTPPSPPEDGGTDGDGGGHNGDNGHIPPPRP